MRIVKKRRRLSKAKIKYVASWTSRLLKNKQTKKISLAFPVQAVIKFAVFFLLSFLLKKKGRKKRKIDTFLFFFLSPSFVKKSFSYPTVPWRYLQFYSRFFFVLFFRAGPFGEKKTALKFTWKKDSLQLFAWEQI